MAKGGARVGSGPAPDPTSERSDRRGIKFTALPSSGHDGPAPEWPLPRRAIFDHDGEFNTESTAAVNSREAELWAWAWRTPQAAAWAQPSEAWRLHSIAMWVRTAVLCESSAATAADKNSLHRFADDIGMTPAGLRVNGWAIAKDEVGEKRADADEKPKTSSSSRGRLSAVINAAG